MSSPDKRLILLQKYCESPLPIVREAVRLQKIGWGSEKVPLPLFGGLAFYLACENGSDSSYVRNYGDIDIVTLSRYRPKVWHLMKNLGYKSRGIWNTLNSDRNIFYGGNHSKQVDIFYDELNMCHKLDFRKTIRSNEFSLTLPITDLMMTKLQVVKMTEKDKNDLLFGFSTHDVTKDEGGINGSRIANYCAGDWGLYKTFTLSLEKLEESCRTKGNPDSEIIRRIAELKDAIENEPKSLSWKMRARIGKRARWYQLPEEDQFHSEQ